MSQWINVYGLDHSVGHKASNLADGIVLPAGMHSVCQQNNEELSRWIDPSRSTGKPCVAKRT